jgi:hypothetical protein
VHDEAPSFEYSPAGHTLHVAVPSVSAYRPELHNEQFVAPVATPVSHGL